MLPSSRVRVASLLDRDNVTAGVAELYDQLDLHAAVVADYYLLEELCRDQKLQINRLQTDLQSHIEIAPRLTTYVQNCYFGLWNYRQNMIKRLHGFQTELARRLGQDHVIR